MSTIDDILNFIMPPLVFLFIGFIFYKIPLVKQGIDTLVNKIKSIREKKEGVQDDVSIYSTIEYEWNYSKNKQNKRVRL